MRQSEFKKKYDPDTGKYTRKHIYGEGENPPSRKTNKRQMTQQEINNKVLQIMSGSGKKK